MWKELASTQKRLLTSFFLFGIASPMATVYMSTFLWRQSKDPIILAVFNIGVYVGITLGFAFNTYLLRRFQSGKLYAFGCVLQGIIPMLLVTLGAQANEHALALGIALGIAKGFFWSNRNTLTSKITSGPHRYRFISTETALGLIAGIVSPPLIGWFIAAGETFSAYSVDQAYQLTTVIGLLLFIAAGVLAWSFTVEALTTKHVFVKHASRLWNTQRLVELVNGMNDGLASVLPLLIILLFLGQEEAVGSIQALAAILSAAGIYAIGKRVQHHHHALLFGTWIVFNLIGSILFSMFYSPLAALGYFVLSGIVSSLRWSSLTSVMYEVVDQEISKNGTHRYVYLVDREFFLNTGRVVGLAVMIVLYQYNQELFIRYGLIAISILAIPLLLLIKYETNRIEPRTV